MTAQRRRASAQSKQESRNELITIPSKINILVDEFDDSVLETPNISQIQPSSSKVKQKFLDRVTGDSTPNDAYSDPLYINMGPPHKN